MPDSNTFHNDIAWLADAGVTKGCNPPYTNTQYCPDDEVTRGQMAAFMKRFAGYIDAEDGTPGQADNADTLDGLDSTDITDRLPVASIFMDLPADIKFAEGIDTATNPATGVYCLGIDPSLGLDSTEVYAQVTVECG